MARYGMKMHFESQNVLEKGCLIGSITFEMPEDGAGATGTSTFYAEPEEPFKIFQALHPRVPYLLYFIYFGIRQRKYQQEAKSRDIDQHKHSFTLHLNTPHT